MADDSEIEIIKVEAHDLRALVTAYHRASSVCMNFCINDFDNLTKTIRLAASAGAADVRRESTQNIIDKYRTELDMD